MAEPATERPHVLAIDDEEANLALLASVLGRTYRVTSFDRPQRALQALRDGLMPDLIVCDVAMPELSGFELHDAVRALPALRSVPFVYLTARDDPRDMRQGMRLGADDYLTKPYHPEELREAVRVRLARVRALRHEPSDHLRVTSLGGLDVRLGERRVQWEAKRAAYLLLYLLESGGRATVDALLEDLWWHAPDANQLHVVVSRLRKALGGRARVETRDECVHLETPGPVSWDAAQFREAAEAALSADTYGALERAAELYGGPFLPDADGPWAERTRNALEEHYVELLYVAVESAPSERARATAEARLERFLETDDATS